MGKKAKSEEESVKPGLIIANEHLLAIAIIMQAAADYASEVKKRKANGEPEPGKEECILIHFFRSRRYERLTALDGEVLMKMIKDDPDMVLHRHHYNGSILNRELREETRRIKKFEMDKNREEYAKHDAAG